MSQLPEQLPPHPLVSNKQINIIRKTAAESLQPVIRKVEEHIEYLLEQTKKLREQNDELNRTIADHKVVNERISQFNSILTKFQQEFIVYKNISDLNNKSTKEHFADIALDIQKIHKNLRGKEQKIADLYQKDTKMNERLEMVRREIQNFSEKMNDRLIKVQSENRSLKASLKFHKENTENSLESINSRMETRQSKYCEIDEKIALYFDERDQLKSLITEALEKVNRTIDIERYEQDWKIIRLQNMNMREDNQKMINSALTPEVRKFLPEIISKMQQLRKVDRLQVELEQEKQKTNKISQLHAKQLIQLQITINENHSELQTFKEVSQEKMSDQNQELIEKFQTQIRQTKQSISSLDNRIYRSLREAEQQLNAQISRLVEKSREQIYELVVEQIPEEQKQFFNKMKEFMPMLDTTKEQVNNRCDDITEFGKNLQAELAGFNNKIVKIRSNMAVQFDTLQKKNKSLEKSINLIFEENFKQIGKILSIFNETLFVNLSCIVENSGGTNGDVFVTYTDGIIYQKSQPKSEELGIEKPVEVHSQNNLDIFYRKLKTTTNMLSKATLQMLEKLTDQLICGDEYRFLKVNSFKPSEHFKTIKEQMFHMNNALILNKETSSIHKKYRETSSHKKRKQTLENRLPSLDVNKTIDISSLTQENREYFAQSFTNDFAPPAKKVERGYRGRYSQMK